jgi:predicted nucleic acid-binding protein
MRVIANTTPLRYLVLMDHQFILPRLYEHILIPPSVQQELQHPRTPPAVHRWMTAPPEWVEVRSPQQTGAAELLRLGAGERDAIMLAQELYADLVLMEDWPGRQTAEARSLHVMGTLRVMECAAEQGLLDLPVVLAQLQNANFYMSADLIQELLARDSARKSEGAQTEAPEN